MHANQVLDLLTPFLLICHEIYVIQLLRLGGVFSDISKAIDKAWHDSLIYKIKSIVISGPLLKLVKSFLSNMSQQVAGVPQGSILEPLFFLIYIYIYIYIQGIIQTKMEVSIQFWVPNLGLSPKYAKLPFRNKEL